MMKQKDKNSYLASINFINGVKELKEHTENHYLKWNIHQFGLIPEDKSVN